VLYYVLVVTLMVRARGWQHAGPSHMVWRSPTWPTRALVQRGSLITVIRDVKLGAPPDIGHGPAVVVRDYTLSWGYRSCDYALPWPACAASPWRRPTARRSRPSGLRLRRHRHRPQPDALEGTPCETGAPATWIGWFIFSMCWRTFVPAFVLLQHQQDYYQPCRATATGPPHEHLGADVQRRVAR